MSKTLLVIGFVWPEPQSSAAGSRMLQLINQFLRQQFKITFVTTANHSEKAYDLESIGVSVKSIKLNDSSFNRFISDLNPNVVLFDRFMTEEQFGWRVAEECPNALRVLDTEDFHGLRKARELALNNSDDISLEHLYNEITKREIASIYRSDLSLIISEAEIEILTKQFKIDDNLLHYLPFLIESISEDEIRKLPSFGPRQHFITIGNFLHAPNYDAVVYLKQTIWPLIREQLPQAELHIYGAYESQKILQLDNDRGGFLIKGFTEDVNVVMKNAKVCLAPLRFGAGLKGKLIDAMKNGTPCAMTSVASEGMFGEFEVNGFIEDEPEIFVKKAVELYRNAQYWKNNQEHGFNILNQRFNKVNFESEFYLLIQQLTENLKIHRQANFIGQLLMHHTMQGTKYMSKWIEEKNR